MNTVEIIFCCALALLFYTYLGYGLVLYLLVAIRSLLSRIPQAPEDPEEWPEVSMVIAAYNEADIIRKKIHNSLALEYPADKLRLLFVTDGSDDGTPEIVARYPQVTLFHEEQRAGKIAAVNRVMPFVNSAITVYSDANTFLNGEALKKIVRHYQDEKVGAVAGEKRIITAEADQASSAGEGFYWQYESALKRLDTALYSVVGAAGELFSIRTKLYETVRKDTLIEDFYMTMRIAQRGYRVVYEPQAYARETASASVAEEQKRKVRIAAGGLQAISRLLPLLNPFRYGILSFQYISHRVLRWTLAPLALLVLLLSNLHLALASQQVCYQLFLGLHLLFYGMAALGAWMQKRKIKQKLFFIPFYFVMMNLCVYAGLFRLLRGKQSVVWTKARRMEMDNVAVNS